MNVTDRGIEYYTFWILKSTKNQPNDLRSQYLYASIPFLILRTALKKHKKHENEKLS